MHIQHRWNPGGCLLGVVEPPHPVFEKIVSEVVEGVFRTNQSASLQCRNQPFHSGEERAGDCLSRAHGSTWPRRTSAGPHRHWCVSTGERHAGELSSVVEAGQVQPDRKSGDVPRQRLRDR